MVRVMGADEPINFLKTKRFLKDIPRKGYIFINNYGNILNYDAMIMEKWKPDFRLIRDYSNDSKNINGKTYTAFNGNTFMVFPKAFFDKRIEELNKSSESKEDHRKLSSFNILLPETQENLLGESLKSSSIAHIFEVSIPFNSETYFGNSKYIGIYSSKISIIKEVSRDNLDFERYDSKADFINKYLTSSINKSDIVKNKMLKDPNNFGIIERPTIDDAKYAFDNIKDITTKEDKLCSTSWWSSNPLGFGLRMALVTIGKSNLSYSQYIKSLKGGYYFSGKSTEYLDYSNFVENIKVNKDEITLLQNRGNGILKNIISRANKNIVLSLFVYMAQPSANINYSLGMFRNINKVNKGSASLFMKEPTANRYVDKYTKDENSMVLHKLLNMGHSNGDNIFEFVNVHNLSDEDKTLLVQDTLDNSGYIKGLSDEIIKEIVKNI